MTLLQDVFKTHSAVFNEENVISFANDDQALKAFEEGAALIPLQASAVIRASGDDRLDFVQGQVTNNVKQLQVGGFHEALMLNHKGHALAQMQILRREKELTLVVEDNARALVQEQLQRHIIFDQVQLKDLTEVISVFSVQGVKAAELLADLCSALPAEKQFVETNFQGASLTIYPSKRSAQGGFDIQIETPAASALFGHLLEKGCVATGSNVATMARVLAGIPKVATEAGEGVLPQEAGLEQAISYTKGCYLGQEIMARIEARGKLRRGLQVLKFSGLPSASVSDVSQAGKRVGRLGQVIEHPEYGVFGLAVVRNDLTDTSVSVAEVSAELVPLPIYS